VHLKIHRRKKDGKEHRYFRIVESRRVSRSKVVHRTVLYLGEINDSQLSAWRKTLEVFDEDRRGLASLSLFPEDRELPAAAGGEPTDRAGQRIRCTSALIPSVRHGRVAGSELFGGRRRFLSRPLSQRREEESLE
jgi:hypothetical protein